MPLRADPRFPAVKHYLATLPRGADSYPSSTCKGSLVRASIAELPVLSPEEFGALPACVRRIVSDPPGVSEWTPTVLHNAVVAAVYDTRFAGGGLAAFERAAFEKGKRLLGGPVYRVAFALVGVERLLRASSRRWAIFHRGSALELKNVEDGAAVQELTYPPNLFFELPLRSLGQSVRAAVAAAGAQDVVVQCSVLSPTSSRVALTWRKRD